MSPHPVSAGVIYAAAFVIAAAVSGLATPLVVRLAVRLGMVDDDGGRAAHARAAEAARRRHRGFPRFRFRALRRPRRLADLAARTLPAADQFDAIHRLVGLLFGSLLILGVGIWDDVMRMRPRNKLVAQIVVALISMLYGFVIPGITNPFDHNPGTNWIDFPSVDRRAADAALVRRHDERDQLSRRPRRALAGVAAISGLFLVRDRRASRQSGRGLGRGRLAGAALGFLPYNFNPARIILGDAGSLFIGYVFATVSIIGASKTAIAISVVVPLLVLALPVLDTAAAIVRRARSGKAITEADRGHFHHQLIFRFGLNVRQAVLLLYAVCFVLGAVALAFSGEFTHVFRHAT